MEGSYLHISKLLGLNSHLKLWWENNFRVSDNSENLAASYWANLIGPCENKFMLYFNPCHRNESIQV